jgi:hypothetical protein
MQRNRAVREQQYDLPLYPDALWRLWPLRTSKIHCSGSSTTRQELFNTAITLGAALSNRLLLSRSTIPDLFTEHLACLLFGCKRLVFRCVWGRCARNPFISMHPYNQSFAIQAKLQYSA